MEARMSGDQLVLLSLYILTACLLMLAGYIGKEIRNRRNRRSHSTQNGNSFSDRRKSERRATQNDKETLPSIP
jgi:hypothetical protein